MTSAEPRRLLIVSQYFWPENFRVNDLATGLASRGWTVTVLTGVPNYPEGQVFPDFAADRSRFATFGPVEIVRVPMSPRGRGALRLMLNYASFVALACTLGIWKLRGRRFEAIFMFETSPITSALPAVLLRRLKRAPLLLWVLDLWPETLGAVGVVRSPRLLALIGVLVSFIYRRCDRILVQSRGFADSIRKHAGTTASMRYLPSWTEAPQAEPMADVGDTIATLDDAFVVMFAGNIGEAQDFPAIVAAALLLRDESRLRWAIVGSGRAEPWLRDAIRQHGLEDRIVLLGRFPPEAMPPLFARADALLVALTAQPLFALTIPGKVQSYLGAGRPILAMLDGEGARVVREAEAGLTVAAGDAAGLAGAVRTLMALPADDRAAMGHKGRRYAAATFDRETLIDRVGDWIDEAIADYRDPAARIR